jgi:hypothetical protein
MIRYTPLACALPGVASEVSRGSAICIALSMQFNDDEDADDDELLDEDF